MQQLDIQSEDGTPLRVIRWGDAERDVLLLHGLAEHEGRYHHVADALVKAGWRVTFLELRGHGKSGGRRGHVTRWREYEEDLQAAASTIGRPYVLVAHSMGGLVALSAALRPRTPAMRAMALSNALLGVAVQAPRIKVAAAGLLSRVLPWLSLTNEIDTALLSHDPEVARAYEADPLVYGTITPRWFTEMSQAQALVMTSAPQATLPLRLMVGTGDGICDHKQSLKLAQTWGGPVSLATYEGAYHELFNEVDKGRVLAELTTWLDTLD